MRPLPSVRSGGLARALRSALRPPSLGTAGLYLFATSAWLSPAAARIAIGLMLLAALGEARSLGRALAGAPVAAAAGLWVLAVLLSYSQAGPVAPVASHSEAATKLAWLAAFLLVAWWIRGDPRRAWTVLTLALAGFLLRRALYLPRMHLEELAAGMRSGLGLPELATAEYAAIALTGMLLASPRFWNWTGTARRGLARLLFRVLWVISGVFLLLLILVSQSRAVWVLVALSLPMVGGWLIVRASPDRRAAAHAGALLALALLGLLLVAYSGFIAGRFAEDTETIRRVLAGEWAAVPHTSGGLRVRLWALGLAWWSEAPWLGNGPAALPALIASTGVPELLPLDDVHNVALDLLVRLGLVGLTAYLAMLGLLLWTWVGAKRAGRVPEDLFLVVLAALTLDALIGLTNCRTLSTDWKFFWLLFAGVAASFGLHRGASPAAPDVSVAHPATVSALR